MHRTQILLEEGQYQVMKDLAERQKRSLSSLVRDAVAAYLAKRSKLPIELREITGIGDDSEARGLDHDDILYGPSRDRS